jgi:circadian clock protein KaiC
VKSGTERRAVSINRLTTGVPGLDEVLGGGLPEYSLTLIAGSPGSGKTTLAQQTMFSLATMERPALHFTVLGEPLLKMLRYQQQFTFFDSDKIDRVVRFVNLSDIAQTENLDRVLETIVSEVERTNPGIVVVDSFRTVMRAGSGEHNIASFLHRLALHLATWQATTFLVGEYETADASNDPVFTVSDGIIWLHQSIDRNSIVRKLQVVKMRGQAPLPGLHTMRITSDGIQVFPRILKRATPSGPIKRKRRLSMGVPELDKMLGGGIPSSGSVLVVGPAGSGKTALAMQFVAAGLKNDEPAVVAVFEEHPKEYLERAKALGPDLGAMVAKGLLEVIYLRPLDLSVDEALLEIQSAVARVNAQRLVVDSLAGFELALAPTFREDFRESLYRMVGSLTGAGVTVVMTAEVPNSFTDLNLSPNLVSFLSDNIILQRYVELDAHLTKVMTVVKMRGSKHSNELRAYEVGEHGLILGKALSDYTDIITGVARRRDDPADRPTIRPSGNGGRPNRKRG